MYGIVKVCGSKDGFRQFNQTEYIISTWSLTISNHYVHCIYLLNQRLLHIAFVKTINPGHIYWNNSNEHILSLIHTFISFVKWLLLGNCLQVIPTGIKQIHNSLMSVFAISIEIALSSFSLLCHNVYQDLCLITKLFFCFSVFLQFFVMLL